MSEKQEAGALPAPMDGRPKGFEFGLGEALAYVTSQMAAANSVHARKLGDYGDQELWAHFTGDGFDMAKTPAPPLVHQHKFRTVTGLLDYLTEHPVDDAPGIIFVGEEKVYADAAYGSREGHRATLPLDHSEEYAALCQLMEGVGQKKLWRLLIGDLDGCFDMALLLQVSNLEFADDSRATVKIDASGLGDAAARQCFRVSLAGADGPASATLTLDWTWRGRVWRCFEEECDIAVRLELVKLKDGGLLFVFHPKRLSEVIDNHRQRLVERIRAGAPERFTVHEGAYC